MPLSRRTVLLLVTLALPVVVVVRTVATRDAAPDPIAVEVVERPAASLEELVARADLIVVGRVAEVTDGRVLTAADAVDRGLRTQYVRLVVDEVTWAADGLVVGPEIVIEEVVALADGTPATAGGLRPSRVGDAGLHLLVTATTPDVATFGPVGPQGRYLLDPADPGRLVAPVDDALAVDLAARGPEALRADVLEVLVALGRTDGPDSPSSG